MLRKTIIAAAAMAFAAGVGSASAATFSYDYTGSATNPGGPALSCGVSGILNGGCAVTYNSAGLGVAGIPDLQPGEIDGSPVFSGESLTFDFGFDRALDSLQLGNWDGNDDLTLTWDGGSLSYGPGVLSDLIDLGGVVSSFLTVTANGVLFADGFLGNDSFTAAKLNVSSVPVPAALPLMAGGLGLLGMLGMRRKRSATTAASA